MYNNKKMGKQNKQKHGFTIIEVTLVLAITALLVTGVMVGTSATISRQRYNDAINDIVDYFRQVYSEVINVQNVRTGESTPAYCSVTTAFDSTGVALDIPAVATPGRTDCAIYGKIVTIGELGDDNKVSDTIHSYDIIGNVYSPDNYKNSAAKMKKQQEGEDSRGYSSSADINLLMSQDIGANAVTFATSDSECRIAPAGNTSYYNPIWGTSLETTALADGTSLPFRGAILIFRSPLSGTVQTYYIDYSSEGDKELPIDITRAISQFAPLNGACNKAALAASNSAKSQKDKYLVPILEDERLTTSDESDTDNDKYITLCVNSDDLSRFATSRRGIRILKGGRNATAVELLNADVLKEGEENPCR